MKTISAFAAVLAVLLLVTPPAGAASKMKNTASSYFRIGWEHYQRGFRQGAPETADRDEAQAAVAAYAMAIATDPKLSGLPDASRLYFSLALCQEALGDYEAAMTSYKAALQAAPGKAVIAAHAARLRLKMKDSQQAVTDLQMAIEKARANGQEDALLTALREEPAFAALRADDVTGRMIGVAPRRAEVAAVDVSGEEMRDAISDAPRSAPKADSGVLEKIAQANVEFRFRRYASAASAYHDALAMNQERLTLSPAQVAAVYEKIGTSYNKLGQAEQAIHFLRKALQQNPADASAHYQIALAYAMSGDNLRAVHALNEAFASASGKTELRRLVMMAKTDAELEAVRDLPGFAAAVDGVAGRVALR